ncbi:MAG: hypothetical protein GYB65_00525, partial [Chloroflexi bacterium]|nr:hypothetical protein [Chloroflexota bacterium]
RPTLKPLDIDQLDDALDDDDDDASDARRAMLGQLDAELGLPGAKDLDPTAEDVPTAEDEKPAPPLPARPTLKPLDIDQLDDALDDDDDDASDARRAMLGELDAELGLPGAKDLDPTAVVKETDKPAETKVAEDAPAAAAVEKPKAKPPEPAPEPDEKPEAAKQAPAKPEPAKPAPPPTTAMGAPPAAASPAAPPQEVFCVLIPLPDELAETVRECRAAGEINDVPPPGVVFAIPFRTAQLDAVQTAITEWTRAHLPLQLEVTGIKAEVIGEQHYLAAWTLSPVEELEDAQRALVKAIAPLIRPVQGARISAQVHVVVGDNIAPGPYPAVIGTMQRLFDTHIWHAEAAALVTKAPDADTWETLRTFD